MEQHRPADGARDWSFLAGVLAAAQSSEKLAAVSASFPNLNSPEGECVTQDMAGYPCVMQMVGVCGPALAAALANGASLGATAFEVYPNDRNAPDNAAILEEYNPYNPLSTRAA